MRATQRIATAYLGPNFQHVFERHARICKLILQQHDHIVVVLLDLLLLSRFSTALGFTLLNIRLERCNLLVDTCNILFNDESELLKDIFQDLERWTAKGYTYAYLHGPVIEQRFTLRHCKPWMLSTP
jgi:hypothetical protein